jgi:alpha-D-ribose 1-methylphosphonate 5-triphosphate synthase subunit PhnH
MNAVLAAVTPGFRDAVHGAQHSFRVVLGAMARPGRVLALPAAAIDGLQPPPSRLTGRPMSNGAAALLLTLLDAETNVHLAGSLASDAALAYLRFHTGTGLAAEDERADFTLARAADVDSALWSRLDLGDDEVPQRGATLLVEVDALSGDTGTALRLRGPGIDGEQALTVQGLSHAFWLWRERLQAHLPRGIELLLVDGVRIAAIPRSTRITRITQGG